MECVAIRERTSRNHAKGSTFTSPQEETKLRRTAIVLPPRSLPRNVQLLRPREQRPEVIARHRCRRPSFEHTRANEKLKVGRREATIWLYSGVRPARGPHLSNGMRYMYLIVEVGRCLGA